MKVIYQSDLNELVAFKERAKARFLENKKWTTYSDEAPEAGSFFAIRWGTQGILVLKISDFHFHEPIVFGDELPESEMATNEWPGFAAAALARIPYGQFEASTEEVTEVAAETADALDAEWEKRRNPMLYDVDIPEGKKIAEQAKAEIDAIRREERERVLEAVRGWLLDTDASVERLGWFFDAWDIGRFDPSKEGE